MSNFAVKKCRIVQVEDIPVDKKMTLKRNCEACRKALTKCDKTGPVCRRCNRKGIPCVTHSFGKLTCDGKEIVSSAFEEDFNMQDMLVSTLKESMKELNLSKGRKQISESSVEFRVRLAIVRKSLWIGFRSKNLKTISEGMQALLKLNRPFSFVEDIFTSTKDPFSINDDMDETHVATNNNFSNFLLKSFFTTERPKQHFEAFYKILPSSLRDMHVDNTKLQFTKFVYYGTLFFNGTDYMKSQFRKLYMAKAMTEAMRQLFSMTTSLTKLPVFFDILTRQRIAGAAAQSFHMAQFTEVSFEFDKRRGPVDAFSCGYVIKSINTTQPIGPAKRTIFDAEVRMIISCCGDYHIKTIRLVDPTNTGNTRKNNCRITAGSSKAKRIKVNKKSKISQINSIPIISTTSNTFGSSIGGSETDLLVPDIWGEFFNSFENNSNSNSNNNNITNNNNDDDEIIDNDILRVNNNKREDDFLETSPVQGHKRIYTSGLNDDYNNNDNDDNAMPLPQRIELLETQLGITSNPFASLFDRVEQLEELMFKAKRVTKQGLTKRIEYLENRI